MKREDILKLEVIPSFFRLYCVASGILVPQPGMEPRSMAVKALVLSTGLPGNSLKVYHLDPKRKAKKGNAKECLNYCTIALISHASKIMLKILQARQRNQRSNFQNPLDHWKSNRVPEKHLFLLHWLCQSLWQCGSPQTVENSERWEYQTTWPSS